ncbi:hypothetical protein M0R45_037671 [Rubus argutus]|uniref:RING-type E3 ubiquitin transferase n=1 Tax=Rubus argutus TaxID=59490 RepID=A0AAW1W3C5_RUBAR
MPTRCKHAYCVGCIRKWSNLRQKCPLRNANFESWFYRFSLSIRNFHIERLPPLNTTSSSSRSLINLEAERDPPNNEQGRRSRPLPWRRSFGRPGYVAADVISERKLQWRASIYGRHLQAVPCAPRNRVVQVGNVNKDGVRERMLQPWIRRELQALLGDQDPSIVIHVVNSVFIASKLENNNNNFLEPLRPFFLDRTDMFWHELICFADSPFNMETYDAVVEYN